MKPAPKPDPIADAIREAMNATDEQHEYARLGGLLTRHYAGEDVVWPEAAE